TSASAWLAAGLRSWCAGGESSCLPIRIPISDTPTTGAAALSLHDALPISGLTSDALGLANRLLPSTEKHEHGVEGQHCRPLVSRSEEHTSELQSRGHLVCRLLLEKKKRMTGGRRTAACELRRPLSAPDPCP